MTTVSTLSKAALIALPVVFLAACGTQERETATTTVAPAPIVAEQPVARTETMEYRRSLRK